MILVLQIAGIWVGLIVLILIAWNMFAHQDGE